MAARSRRKGKDGEREVVRLFTEAGYKAVRTAPLEAGGQVKGDVYVSGIGVVQVKLGSHVPCSFGKWLEDADILLTRRDRERWVVSMSAESFIELLRVAKA